MPVNNEDAHSKTPNLGEKFVTFAFLLSISLKLGGDVNL